MENPKERDEKWRAHMRIMRSNADALKDQWSQPTKHNSYWQSVPMTNKFKQEVARGGSISKGFMIQSAQSDANSVAAVIQGLEK